jgi:two-component system, OmpR family, sensor histidine kinase KdpD
MQSGHVDTKTDIASLSGNWKVNGPAVGIASTTTHTGHLGAKEELRSALLDSVAHDLRSPLTAIRVASEALMFRPRLTERERDEMIAIVDEESRRLERLIGQTIKIAQLDPRAVRVNAQPQDLRKLIHEVVEDARSWLRRHNVRIRVANTLPFVPMDRELLGRVLRHLLENASLYSPPDSSIVISGGIGDGRLVVTVADQGSGIDAAEEPFIFEKSFRGKHQRLNTQGTGMGLAIVKAIINAHGGEIRVAKCPGQGTAFTFWIPTRA